MQVKSLRKFQPQNSEKKQFPQRSHFRDFLGGGSRRGTHNLTPELELELIQTQMTQKPMLRGEVGARAWRLAEL